jgi:histidinol-phosphate aminotransferase
MERNIHVRWFDVDRLRDKLRVTIGTPEENASLITALREIIG